MKTKAMLLVCALLAMAVNVRADSIPYPDSGTLNPLTYTFTAAADGDITAYIVGGFSAGFENQIGMSVNGGSVSVFGLDNHSSSVGDSLVLGSVHAGDTLTFVLKNLSLGTNAYSDPSLNVAYDDGSYTGLHTHVYSTAYTATSPVFAGVPAGTYVAFEDLPFPGADYNYDDESFVFTNVRGAAAPAAVPLPGAAWSGLILLAGLVALRGIRGWRGAAA